MKKKLLWAMAIMFLVAGGVYYATRNETLREAQKLEFASIQRGTIEDIITAQGKLEPKDYVNVGAQVSGQLKKLYFDIGDTVKKDELLAEIDPQAYLSRIQGDEARIKSLKAQLDQQRAQVEYDAAQLTRAQKLTASKAISQQELEEKEKAYKVSVATVASIEAQIAEAEASLEADRINLGYTKIYAPMDGVISELPVREGQTLNANQTTPTILQIANLSVMTIRAQVAEADVSRLKPGMEATFVTLGSTERKWKGNIRQILPTPEVVNDVVLFNALIDVENAEGQLMNGMSTQDSFVVGRAENALIIPLRALGRRVATHDDPQRGQAYIVQLAEKEGKDSLVEREIWVGLVTRAGAEVKDGLVEGDRVLVSGMDTKERRQGQATGRPPMLKTGRL